MAIASRGAGAAVYSAQNGSSVAPAVNGTTAVGDRMILVVMTKPDTGTVADIAGWDRVGEIAGGTGTTGIDTGPTRLTVFSRIATASGTANNPGTVTLSGSNISGAQIVSYYHGAGNTSEIVFTGAADTTTGTPHSATMPINPGLTAGDYLVAAGVIPTDVTTPLQFSAETVSATGMTTVTLTEVAELDTSTGQDLGGWIAHGPVVTGTATAAPTVSATAGGTTTNVAGPIGLVRMREIPTTATKSASDSGTVSATETASITAVVSKTASDSGTVSATESASVFSFVPPPEPTVAYYVSDNTTGTSLTLTTGVVSAAVDDVVIVISSSDTLTDTPSAPTVNSGSVTFSNLVAPGNGNRVSWGRVTSAGVISITNTTTTANGFYSVMVVVRGADKTLPPMFRGNINQVLDNAGYFDETEYNYELEVAFTRCNDQLDQHLTNYGTVTTWIQGQTPSGYTYETSTITDRPVAGTGYDVTLDGFVTANTTGFGIALKPAPSPDVVWTPIANPETSGTQLINEMYKDVTVAVGAGDLVVATGVTDNANGSGNATLATQSGSTNTWTVGRSINANGETGFVMGHAEVTSGTSLTVRITAPSSNAGALMGGGVWVIKAGKWSGTPTYTAFGPSDTDAKVSVVVGETSTVLFSGGDWTAGAPGTTTQPLGGEVGTTYNGDGTRYAVATRWWMSQAAGTRLYGVASPAGNDWGGAVVQIPSSTAPASEPISGSDSGAFSATDSASITAVSVVASDSGTFSATDTSANASTLSRTDTGTISVTDSSTNASTLSVSDTGTISVTDASALLISNSLSVSDTGSVSATETAQVTVTIATSDSGSIAAVDVSSNSSTLSRTDAGSISATDTSSNSSTVALSESGSLSVTETTAISVVLSATDSGAVSATDTSNVVVTFLALSVSDTGTLTATDTSSNTSTLARTDTGTISATEASSSLVTSSVNDSGSLSGTDAISTLANTLATSDSGTLSSAEAIANAVSFTTTDSGTISTVETISGAGTAIPSDTGSISSTDTASVLVTLTVSDSGSISGTEGATDLQVFGVISKAGSDSGTLSATDTSSMQQSLAISTSDSGTLSATEARQIASTTSTTDSGIIAAVESIAVAGSSTRTDSGTISATDSATIFNDRPGSDSGVFSATETASVAIFGLVLKSGSDTGSISATDAVIQRGAYVQASDTGTLSATDTSLSALSSTGTDSGAISATESSAVYLTPSASDTGTLSATESSSIVATTGTQVSVWTGAVLVTGPLAVWNGTEFVYPNVYAWNGSAMVLVS